MHNINDDDDGWIENKSKKEKKKEKQNKTKKAKAIANKTRINRLFLQTEETFKSHNTSELNDNSNCDDSSNTTNNMNNWTNHCFIGNILELMDKRLEQLHLHLDGNIDVLWNLLHRKLCVLLGDKYAIKNSSLLRKSIKDRNKNTKDENTLLDSLSRFYHLKIRIHSLESVVPSIVYGTEQLNFVDVLHIGFKHFALLTKLHFDRPMQLSNEDKKLVASLNEARTVPSVSSECFQKEKVLVNKIRKILAGKQTSENVFPEKRRNKISNYYDVYSPEQLRQSEYWICTLKLINPHLGKAILLENNVKLPCKEIELLSRKSCGFQAFNGDKVAVKIIDAKRCTGKVVCVLESYHKPVNKLYVCKMNNHQGSLMKPIDGSIPKIHVDNEPGRRKYQLDLKKKQAENISNAQKSFGDHERESRNFADNKYYTVFQVSCDKDSSKPCFSDPVVHEIQPDTLSKLFLVCYEYWDPFFMYPNGKILATLTQCNTFPETFHLICLMSNIDQESQVFKEEINEIRKSVELLIPNFPLDSVVFTIDNVDTQEIDDAISFSQNAEEYTIGVHISDVTKFISPQHKMYQKAKEQFLTFYPKHSEQEPLYLFNKNVSTNYLSLIPDKPRAVLSVIFTFNANDLSKPTNVTFNEYVIVSKYKLNYKQVTTWLKETSPPNGVDEDLLNALKVCFEIAKKIREKRLPASYFVRQFDYVKLNYNYEDVFDAHVLVEEFMILSNETVAKFVYSKWPNMSLLRAQAPMSDPKKWTDQLYKHMNMNFAAVLKDCVNLLHVNRNNKLEKNDLVVSRQFFDLFDRYLKSNVSLARNMLQYDAFYNDFYFHIVEWYKLNQPAVYQCSSENTIGNRHFNLNKEAYTHFTSPIRRFADVVVHLLLKSVIKSSTDVGGLDQSEIEDVCLIGNKRKKDQNLFKISCESYILFESKTNVPVYSFILDCVVTNIEIDKIHFDHPLLKKFSSKSSTKFADLSLDEIPVSLKKQMESSEFCDFRWSQIFYSCDTSLSGFSKSHLEINDHLYDATLSAGSWKLLKKIRRSWRNAEDLKHLLLTLMSEFRIIDDDDQILSNHNWYSNPIIHIHLKKTLKSTLRVQFCKYRSNELLKAVPELLIITSTFHLCLIHQEDPELCFVPRGKLNFVYNDVKQQFDSITRYQQYFEPQIRAESLVEALHNPAIYSLRDVRIKWILAPSRVTKCQEIYGIIQLDLLFCKHRNIKFYLESEEANSYKRIIDRAISSVGSDFVCIRCWRRNHFWIGHGEILNVSKVTIEGREMKMIVFMLTQSDSDVSKLGEDEQFFINIFFKPVSSIRQTQTIHNIHKDKFLRNVVLNCLNNEQSDSELDDIDKRIMKDMIRNFNLNKNQQESIQNAFTKKFSLIWGPPGTGKTLVGCILAYSYVQRNKERNSNGVVMYCGPSNDCVNLVANEMDYKFTSDCPAMLRIFGKDQELADFPLPGHISKNSKLTNEFVKSISLHHLIRQGDGELAKKIKEYDKIFENISSSEMFDIDDHEAEYTIDDSATEHTIYDFIDGYKNLIKKAKLKFIKDNKFSIILCTTSVSVTYVPAAFDISQIIVDEAGMCTEPETLVPLQRKGLKNVVLIGDHKQLRPIIHNKLAAKHGLEISLFERYQHLRKDLVTMLNRQYRMHPSICEFPSVHFYDGQLKTNVCQGWAGLNDGDMDVDKFEEKFNKSNLSSKDCYKMWNGIDYSVLLEDRYRDHLRNSNLETIPNNLWPERKSFYSCFDRKFSKYYERIMFFNIVGDELVQSVTTSTGNENSRANDLEIDAIEHVYGKMIERMTFRRKGPEYITILTQYKLQESRIFDRLKNLLVKKKIPVDPIVKTVIRSQGSENDYIIFSTVRSIRNPEDFNHRSSPGWERNYLGFITDQNQVNVALTRARKGLIIFGNKELLRVNEMWNDIISDLEKRKCVRDNFIDFI